MPAKKPSKKAAKKATKGSVKKAPAKKAAARKKAAAKKAAARTPGAPRADKGEGAGAVSAVIRKLPAEHRAMAERFDAIVSREAPDAKRAVKWGSPMWGMEGRGWFASFGSFKSYAKVSFFSGASLKPTPPDGEGKGMRSMNIPTLADFDDARMASWVKQAAAIPGGGK